MNPKRQVLVLDTHMTKVLTILFALALGIAAGVIAHSRYAEASLSAGCRRWAVQAFVSPGNREVAAPEGWEPFAGAPGGFTARRCIEG
jgi:hypothetical protein